MTNGNVLSLWHYDKFLRHLEQHHVHNDELDFSDNGLVRNFHLASFRVRFSICALRSFPHFIISC